MNITALPELILSWFKDQGNALLQSNKTQPPLDLFVPGQQYNGVVQENLSNGRSLVQVGNQLLDLALPDQAKPGDPIRMTYIQSSPRPTFVLTPVATPKTTSVTVSQAAQQVSALTRYVPVSATTSAASAPAAATSATSTAALGAASAAAKPILSNPAVLLVPAQAQTAAAQTLVAGLPPLSTSGEAVESMHATAQTNSSLATARGLEGTQGTVQELPIKLLQTVKESGLFYESHLGKWVRGELSLESIQREPQARLSQTPGPLLDLPDLEGMPQKAAELASRQLNMLDGTPFVWQGQAWPGQDMQWQVTEREGDGQGDSGEAQKWQSRLRLILPRLGGISASLDIGALGLRINLRADSEAAQSEIKAAMPELAHRLKTAGLNLTSIVLESNHADA